MPGEVQVKDHPRNLWFVPGLKGGPHLRPGPLDGLLASARGRGQTEYLGPDNRVARLPEELHDAIEGEATVPACGSN